MEVGTFLAGLDALLDWRHVGERGIEIAVGAGDHVGGRRRGKVEEGPAASKHGELKREFQREQKEWDKAVREGRVKVDESEDGDVKEEADAVKDEEEEVKVKEESDDG